MDIATLLTVVDRDNAWSWIRRVYLPDGLQCPRCGAAITGQRALEAFASGKEKIFCASCGRSFRSRAVTPLIGTEWEPEEYVKLLIMDWFGMGAAQIAAILGKSPRCVRDMVERIRLQDPEELPFD